MVTNDLLTLESLGTLSGASFATVVVGNVSQRVFNFNPKWLGLAMAQVIMLGVALAQSPRSGAGVILAILNGFVVYAAAVGVTTTVGQPEPTEPQHMNGGGPAPAVTKGRRRFWTRWF